ncbi:FxLYD domain-containing protein [Prochlorothrix hollandica]|uniref:FxLYD domain-containing protein n=1 Tax=Prochlorothrix hollandica TaxID=1223 RepID=UPI0033421697
MRLMGFQPRLPLGLPGTKTLVLAVCLWILSWTFTLPAAALTPLKMMDLDYAACPADIGQGAVTSNGTTRPAQCFLISGTVVNSSGKTVYDADVYGRIYDATGNSVMQNRGRIGNIEEVPPGNSPFEVRVSIPQGQPAPLQLKQFKASGFSGPVKNFNFKQIRP